MSELPALLTQELSASGMYEEVCRQIAKDFGSCGVEVVFLEHPGTSAAMALVETLSPVMTELVRHHRSQLLKIVYRVDIPESQLGRTLENLQAGDASHALTLLIISREIRKVILRKNNR